LIRAHSDNLNDDKMVIQFLIKNPIFGKRTEVNI
jgi:hypothetical protein